MVTGKSARVITSNGSKQMQVAFITDVVGVLALPNFPNSFSKSGAKTIQIT